MMPEAYVSTIDWALKLFLTAFIGGIGIWALKAYIKERTTLPKAKNGFLTLQDLKAHCSAVQEQCLGNLIQKMDAIAHVIDQRLGHGDRMFNEHAKRLREIERNMVKLMEDFNQFEKGLCDRIVAVMVKHQKREP
ncbi:MAG: hypothetical protein JRJ03_18430 [Deltaproteobacteria bacterium]|nr:hypothetical protein [Deltaproteobacteria bacterium]